jgi:SAM-dependent methyltransferase
VNDTDWESYARKQPHSYSAYADEPVQLKRIKALPARCVGTVLDVGSSDGYTTASIDDAGHWAVAGDISYLRCERALNEYSVPAVQLDATALPFRAGAFATVVLGEILEHLVNPGAGFAEACRVAGERVVTTLPLNGWADPTHRWRISLDKFVDRAQHREDPTKGEQVTVTWQRGECWPATYYVNDAGWISQFVDGQ